MKKWAKPVLVALPMIVFLCGSARADNFFTSGGPGDPFKITAVDCGGCDLGTHGLPTLLPADPVMIPDHLRPKPWADFFNLFGSSAEWISYDFTGKEVGQQGSGTYKESLLPVLPNDSILTFRLDLPGPNGGVGNMHVGADDTIRVILMSGQVEEPGGDRFEDAPSVPISVVLIPFPDDLSNNGPCQLDVVGCQKGFIGSAEFAYSPGSYLLFEVLQTHLMAYGWIGDVNAFPNPPVTVPEPNSFVLLGVGLAASAGLGVIRRRRRKDHTSPDA